MERLNPKKEILPINSRNGKKSFILIIVAISSLIFLAGCAKSSIIQIKVSDDAPDDFVSEVKNELFIAKKTPETLDISIFSPIESKIIFAKNIPFKDELNYSGEGKALQYNPKTKEIFFSTQGYSDYMGDCINEDGTCFSRIYKVSLNETKPLLLFEAKKQPDHWLLNSFDHSLFLIYSNGKFQTLKKISTLDGKEIFTKLYPQKTGKYFADLKLSKDGKYIYQAGKESFENTALKEILWLRKIDNETGEITEQKVYQGDWIEFETDLSPNENYLAFYSGIYEPEAHEKKLFIYDLNKEESIELPFGGRVGNYNLFWSGDSKKLLYLSENSAGYYDLETQKIVRVSEEGKKITYIYSWSTSGDYFAFPSGFEGDDEIKVYDLKSGKTLSTGIKVKNNNIATATWY